MLFDLLKMLFINKIVKVNEYIPKIVVTNKLIITEGNTYNSDANIPLYL